MLQWPGIKKETYSKGTGRRFQVKLHGDRSSEMWVTHQLRTFLLSLAGSWPIRRGPRWTDISSPCIYPLCQKRKHWETLKFHFTMTRLIAQEYSAALYLWTLYEQLPNSTRHRPSEKANSRITAFCRNRRSFTVFITARHWCQSRARWIQSTSFHPISLGSVLILSSYLRLIHPSGLFPSCFQTKISNPFLVSPMRATFPAYAPSRFYNPVNILWGVEVMNLLNVHFCLASCYFLLLSCKHSPQQVLKLSHSEDPTAY